MFVNILLALMALIMISLILKFSNFKLGISEILIVCLLLYSLGVYSHDITCYQIYYPVNRNFRRSTKKENKITKLFFLSLIPVFPPPPFHLTSSFFFFFYNSKHSKLSSQFLRLDNVSYSSLFKLNYTSVL